ncbi:winged helix-turn-helix domain-containing protein, partial [Gaiella sp.]|uniref:AfsR/SARP family transcriptional regulator n=1 Tax=Gaiella sp. TaxID=2663207 RepID=UPI0032662796
MLLEYRILGPLEITRDLEPIVVSAPKEQTLFVHLLLHANERVSVDRLAAAIWGEERPASAEKLLQLYVSNLRKAVGSGVIATV